MKKFISSRPAMTPRSTLDVIIRGVRSRLYREFKGRAASMGVKVGEALQEAIARWLEETSPLPLAMSNQNQLAYAKMRPEISRKYHGKYAAVYDGGKLIASQSFEDLADKLKELEVKRAVVCHVGVDESGEGGEWLWGSIER